MKTEIMEKWDWEHVEDFECVDGYTIEALFEYVDDDCTTWQITGTYCDRHNLPIRPDDVDWNTLEQIPTKVSELKPKKNKL